jgi:hypothetical protein
MPANFYKTNQPQLLEAAKTATGSTGWRADAVAFGVRNEPDDPPSAIIVFQGFEGGAAEMHFGMINGHTMGPELVQGIFLISFHPRMLALSTLFAPIRESNIPAQVAALKVGFKFEYKKPAIAPGAEDAIVFSMRRWEASGQTANYETQTAQSGD